MSLQSILEWVIPVTSNLLPCQSATLAARVAVAVRAERLNLTLMAAACIGGRAVPRIWSSYFGGRSDSASFTPGG